MPLFSDGFLFREKPFFPENICQNIYGLFDMCKGFPGRNGGVYIGETRGVEIGVEHRDEEEVRTHLF